jgi:hypothetical protein
MPVSLVAGTVTAYFHLCQETIYTWLLVIDSEVVNLRTSTVPVPEIIKDDTKIKLMIYLGIAAQDHNFFVGFLLQFTPTITQAVVSQTLKFLK